MLPLNPRRHKRNKMIKNIGKKVCVKGREEGGRNTDPEVVRSEGVGKEGSKEGKYCRKQRISRSQFPGGSELEDTWAWKCRFRMKIQ